MHDRLATQLVGDRGEERIEPPGGIRHPVVQCPGRHLDTEQVVQRLGAAFTGQMLRAHQIDGVCFDPRAVNRWRGRLRREHPRRFAPASAATPLRLVFGHDHPRVRDIEHLAGHDADHLGVIQRSITRPAPIRAMNDHLVRIGDLRQRVPWRARLFPLSAAHRPACSPVRVLRPIRLGRTTVRRRRLRRVRRVPGELFLQISDPAHHDPELLSQLTDVASQLSVLRLKLGNTEVHPPLLALHARTTVDIARTARSHLTGYCQVLDFGHGQDRRLGFPVEVAAIGSRVSWMTSITTRCSGRTANDAACGAGRGNGRTTRSSGRSPPGSPTQPIRSRGQR